MTERKDSCNCTNDNCCQETWVSPEGTYVNPSNPYGDTANQPYMYYVNTIPIDSHSQPTVVKCPCCDGWGIRTNHMFNLALIRYGATTSGPEMVDCPSCNGKGYLILDL